MKTNSKILKLRSTKDLKLFIKSLGIDLVGIADLPFFNFLNAF